MQDLNTLGALISAISVILVFVGSLVGIRFRRTSTKYKQQQEVNKRQREVQEKLIQATDYLFQVREWAAQRGLLNQLPELPQILRFEYVVAKAEEEPTNGPYTQLLDQLSTIQKVLSPMESPRVEHPPSEVPPHPGP